GMPGVGVGDVGVPGVGVAGAPGVVGLAPGALGDVPGALGDVPGAVGVAPGALGALPGAPPPPPPGGDALAVIALANNMAIESCLIMMIRAKATAVHDHVRAAPITARRRTDKKPLASPGMPGATARAPTSLGIQIALDSR